jgi:hypothetical protein
MILVLSSAYVLENICSLKSFSEKFSMDDVPESKYK